MTKVLYNALHLTGQFSGVQYSVEQLMKEAFRNPDPKVCLEALCPYDYSIDTPVHPTQKLTRISINSANRLQRIGYEHFFLKQYFKRKSKHILHCPAYILPWNWKYPSVITVHDIIALDYPEYCSSANHFYFKFLLPNSIRKATKIIAVSHTVKNDILRKFKINPEKIEVIYPGICEIFKTTPPLEKQVEVKQKYRLPEKYILYIGNIEPKKNIVSLIKAFKKLIRQSDIPHSLVIAGKLAWKYDGVLREINKPDTRRIMYTGYVSREDLPSLYTLADLFAFPSLYEGFGIPPLEAMACNTPVICSNRGALPEVVGKSAFLVDALSVDSITHGMMELIHNANIREDLMKEGKEHVRQFKWSKTWADTVKLYDSLL